MGKFKSLSKENTYDVEQKILENWEKIDILNSDLDLQINSMDELLEIRKKAREEKNWDLADKIRISLDKVGIVVKDSKDGTVWELKK